MKKAKNLFYEPLTALKPPGPRQMLYRMHHFDDSLVQIAIVCFFDMSSKNPLQTNSSQLCLLFSGHVPLAPSLFLQELYVATSHTHPCCVYHPKTRS